MKYIILTVSAIILSVAEANTECFNELDDGTLVKIECVKDKPQPMTAKQIVDSLDRFKSFENSSIAPQVKVASMEYAGEKAKNAQIKETQFHKKELWPALIKASPYSKDVLRKLAHMREDKHIVKITYLKDPDIPKKI